MPRITTKVDYALALCLFDSDHIPEDLRLACKLDEVLDRDPANIVKIYPDSRDEDDMKETGAVFTCDLLQAALVCDVIRNHDRASNLSPTRVYIHRKVWTRISGMA